MNVEELSRQFDSDFAYSTAMSFDNVGHLIGDKGAQVQSVLLAVDVTHDVIKEVALQNCNVIVTHHPVIFHPLKSIYQGSIAYDLIQKNISVISLHTNLDLAVGGVNDCLAAALNLQQVCQLGEDGLGRVGTLPQPMTAEQLAGYVKQQLHAPCVRFNNGSVPISKIAVGGGACGDFLRQAADAGCDTFVTGDVKYNQFRDAQYLGLNLIDAGHFWTENVVCRYLAQQLAAQFAEIPVVLSTKHTDVTKFAG